MGPIREASLPRLLFRLVGADSQASVIRVHGCVCVCAEGSPVCEDSMGQRGNKSGFVYMRREGFLCVSVLVCVGNVCVCVTLSFSVLFF